MLYGDLECIDVFKANPALHRALLFLKEKAPALPEGRYDLPDGAYAAIREYAPSPREERRYEAHDEYADVQCVLEGDETIYVRPRAGLEVEENLLRERDLVFYRQPDDGVVELPFLMRPGFFLLLYPDDAHKPECLTTARTGRKIVVKIPVALL